MSENNTKEFVNEINSSDKPKQTNDEYDKLISFFKTVLGIASAAIGVVATTALIFTYSSINDLKKEVQDKLTSINNETTEYIKRLDNKTDKSYLEYQNSLENYTKYSEKVLDRTQEFALREIEVSKKWH